MAEHSRHQNHRVSKRQEQQTDRLTENNNSLTVTSELCVSIFSTAWLSQDGFSSTL